MGLRRGCRVSKPQGKTQWRGGKLAVQEKKEFDIPAAPEKDGVGMRWGGGAINRQIGEESF